MKESHLPTLLQLRLLVGVLGERAQFAWWPTAFYESSGRLFLEPVFSKTTRLAQYHGVLEAARRLHDEHLSVGCFHLFRLPEEVEQDLYTLVQSRIGQDLASQIPQGNETALDTLQHLAGARTPEGIGPIAVGRIKELESLDTLQTIAGAYWKAFSQDVKTFPYWISES